MPQHCDPDVLALLALGESTTTHDDEEHLAGCSRCQSDLDQLRGVVATSRSVEPEDHPQAPPPEVWHRVAAELGLGGAGVAGGRGAGGRGAGGRRGPSWRMAAALAAAAALIGVLGTLGVSVLAGDDSSPTSGVVARAALAPLPQHQGSGTAQVVGAGPDRALDLSVAGLGTVDGFHEVWLLNSDGKRLVSLGLLRGDRGSFALPAGVDLADYPIVDVSIEPADGDPAHSGNSVVRGTLSS